MYSDPIPHFFHGGREKSTLTPFSYGNGGVGMASLRSQLERLESLRETFGTSAASEKLQLLADLEHKSLGRAADVERLHEALCFSRAWPDNPKLLATVHRMLKNFSDRADLNRFAGALENSGIDGTDIRFKFYRVTALWLAQRCGESLHLDWQQFEDKDRLSRTLESLALFSERGALRQYFYDAPDWIDRMRSEDETDAAFLVRLFTAPGAACGAAGSCVRRARHFVPLVHIRRNTDAHAGVRQAKSDSVPAAEHQAIRR